MKILLLILFLTSLSFSQNFSESSCLKLSIDFWEQVYIKYDQSDVIFHNSETFQIYIVKTIPQSISNRNELINHTMDSLRNEYPNSSIRMQSGIKTRFSEGIERQKKYEKMILKEIRKRNLPEELLYLPHVESSYNPNAKSKVGAISLWQIMPQTGRLYGIKNKKNLYNPEISTKVALSLLEDNFTKTGSWELALIAYNSGADGMQIAIKQLNTQDVCIIIDQYKGPRFKFASRNFISQFLAVKRIMDCRD